ncbi:MULTISPECIES: hypothetical protein [unclassified Campylobacter]|uniref:hypothetical protein n=1 Tax=unclassified Campylobacter TaxID=2593542 RepID=UPI0022E9FA66|nr:MULTISPECIES: hypothetical protein [unclassified Campylobacter]MDA3079210.1 hypothetical protein [Campylobacter sp. CS_NA2]MDA3080487.1 hypothetical protein [Campylobacter sp. CS_NA1]MDA3085308.1 hypothetical protein [Campylobacter sp. CS_ED1]MDA3090085.1 hypothetical protein [Campylobacter sp. CS_ED2]WBR51377.1 hypothetical protein PF026_00625 [Campylobacter sp. CS_NA3]
MNFDEVFSTEPQRPAEVPYADLKKKFYIAFGLIAAGALISMIFGPAGGLLILIGFIVKILAVIQTKQIASSDRLLFNFLISVIALVIGVILLTLVSDMSMKSLVSGINFSVILLALIAIALAIVSLVFSFRYYQEFAYITGIKLFIYVFALFIVGGLIDKLSPALATLVQLVAVALEAYAVYLITDIRKSAYIYKLMRKEPKNFKPQIDESLEDLHRLNSNSREF